MRGQLQQPLNESEAATNTRVGALLADLLSSGWPGPRPLEGLGPVLVLVKLVLLSTAAAPPARPDRDLRRSDTALNLSRWSRVSSFAQLKLRRANRSCRRAIG